ncbi:lipase family protein [Rhodococcus sp. BH5]|uniref:lipase family protein n=1 Tax=Rhodococcus sp. BH5 TaxID=2871702 RepID=UPI0022CDB538|nr:lipase family protein [Rhodococcus sp. BH5]MCZ9635190.1 lipase family protein [Rhodococcus sp. BH5]
MDLKKIRKDRTLGAIFVTASIASTLVLGTVPPANAEEITYPAALTDPFYGGPVDLTNLLPGDVLAARALPAPPGFINAEAIQIKFRSTNSEGSPITAVTTILSPLNAQVDRPLLSYQHIINALGLECAPSQTLYTSNPNLIIREAPGLNFALQQGWSVAIPDHLGPTSAYGAARLGAQITLDGIRAAQRYTHLNLRDSPIGMAGYSGGGMATAMAAALAPEYAPELRLVGSAYGGAPLNIGEMAKKLGDSPHPAFGLAMAAALGLEREYPDRMSISSQLNPQGRVLRDSIANACTNEILAAGAGKSINDVADAQLGKLLLDSPSVQEVLSINSVEKMSTVPSTPIYEWHAADDALIPVDAITRTLRHYCDSGVTVQSNIVQSPDHISAAILGLPGAVQFLMERFAGQSAITTCQLP